MQQLQQDTELLPKFAPRLALPHFNPSVLAWQEAGWWMIDSFHLDGKRCPHCQTEIADEVRLTRWYQTERIKCSGCGVFFTSLTGTPLHGSTLDPRELYLLQVLLELNVEAETIATIISVNKETVKRWRQRFGLESTSA